MREYGEQPITNLDKLISSFEAFTARAQPETVEYDATKDFVLITWANTEEETLQHSLDASIEDGERSVRPEKVKHLTAYRLLINTLETYIRENRDSDAIYDNSYGYLDTNFGNIASETDEELKSLRYAFRDCIIDKVLQDK